MARFLESSQDVERRSGEVATHAVVPCEGAGTHALPQSREFPEPPMAPAVQAKVWSRARSATASGALLMLYHD
jgi:hypothetical protein